MKRNIGEKRRIRQFAFKAVRYASIFLLSLIVLLLLSARALNKKSLVNPLAMHIAFNTNHSGSGQVVATIESLLQKQNITYTSVQVASESSLLVVDSSGETYIFSTQKDLSEQLASLQAIKTHLTIEGKRLKQIDFRFDNPVVAF